MNFEYLTFLYQQIANRCVVIRTQNQNCMCTAPVAFRIDPLTVILYIIHFASPECYITGRSGNINTLRICVVLRIMSMTDVQVLELHIAYIINLHQSIPPPFDIQTRAVYLSSLTRITFQRYHLTRLSRTCRNHKLSVHPLAEKNSIAGIDTLQRSSYCF